MSSRWLRRASPLHGPIDRGAGHREKLFEFADRVGAGVIQLDQVRLLSWAELGLLAAQPALGSGYRHALARPSPSKIGFELGDHGQRREQQPSDRVGRVVDGSADVESHTGGGKFVDDVAGVGDGTGEPVELGDDEGVAAPAGREGFA